MEYALSGHRDSYDDNCLIVKLSGCLATSSININNRNKLYKYKCIKVRACVVLHYHYHSIFNIYTGQR